MPGSDRVTLNGFAAGGRAVAAHLWTLRPALGQDRACRQHQSSASSFENRERRMYMMSSS
jgi:hypothetical protein